MQAVITYVRCNDLAEPIIRVALERSKHQTDDHPFSIYRDILFLAFTVLGRTNIDQGRCNMIKILCNNFLNNLQKLQDIQDILSNKND